jgi:adenosylcobinamide-GDP ribazoletransferase
MRDSRLGAYGTIALILLFATKLAVLWPMDVGTFAASLVPAMVLGRASSLALMRALPPASESLAALAGPPTAAGSIVASATVAASLVGFGRWAALPFILSVVVAAGAAVVSRRKVGGVNGDLLGATDQLVEVAVLLAASAVLA